MLPDLPVLDHEQSTETSDHSRGQVIRRARIEAITQATAAAKTKRVLRTKTTITGQHYYNEGDLVDYHRPTPTKDDWGGWNGRFPVVRNDPERGQVMIRVGSRDVQVQYDDARHSFYIEALIARGIGSDNIALRTLLTFVASLPEGRPALGFGYVPTKKGTLQMTSAADYLPMYIWRYNIKIFFRIENVVSVRLAKGAHRLPPVACADSCTLVHYDNDVNPGFMTMKQKALP
eukprot:3405942-Pyramimonas_sp.AAC.1